MLVTRVIVLTILFIVFSAFSISIESVLTRETEFLMRVLIFFVVWALRLVRLRILFVITVKLRFCLFVRAVLIAVFSARILVWKVISSITLIMSVIFFELSAILCIVFITLFIILSSCWAVSEVFCVSCEVWRALSAFCFIVAVSCFMLAVVFFSADVCCLVREERSVLFVVILRVSV